MNKILFVILIILYQGLANVSASDPSNQSLSIDMAVTHWPPYMDQTKEDDYFRALIRQAFDYQDVEVTFHFVPWKRAIRGVDSGTYDGIAPIYFTNDRLKKYYYTAPYHGGALVFLAREDSPKPDLKNLGDIMYGVVDGYANTDLIDSLDEEYVMKSSSDSRNIDLLEKGRVDFSVIDRDVAEYLLKQRKKKVYKIVEPEIEFKQTYLAFPKSLPQSPELVKIFNQGLLKLILSGEMQELRETHLSEAISTSP